MPNQPKSSRSNWRSRLAGITLAALCIGGPQHVAADIVWSGGFETGNFKQWHILSDPNEVHFHQVPAYGRPIQYGGQNPMHVGDGSLLSLVDSPTRGGPYAAKFTVKNAVNGSEPEDCDGSLCTRRRTELTVQQTLSDYYDALPYMSERWVSFSIYIPSDWDNSGSGWGPTVFQIKPRREPSPGVMPFLEFGMQNSTWKIFHRWSPVEHPTMDDLPWQQQMFYTGDEGGKPYPRSDNWPDGLADFPDVSVSNAALQSVNKGGWTDWVIRVTVDARGAGTGGSGTLSVWKREDSGPWAKVLHIVPKRTTRGAMTFDHGIGYNSPAGAGHNGGFGIKTGLYFDKDQVWGNANNRVVYIANLKVGNENAVFAQMSPDGSSPDTIPAPKSPMLAPVE